jgi:hypothetical protein
MGAVSWSAVVCMLVVAKFPAMCLCAQIIEHSGVDAEASSGSRRISAGREMLFGAWFS